MKRGESRKAKGCHEKRDRGSHDRRLITTSGRDGRKRGKDVCLKNARRDSRAMLSLLNDYRARRSRSTPLLDSIGMFTEGRMAALDGRLRFLTSAATDCQRLVATCPHDSVLDDSAPKSRCPRPIVPPLWQMCKTNPNDERGQNREPLFFRRKTNISSLRDPGVRTCFCETNPNRKSQDSWWQYVAKTPYG